MIYVYRYGIPRSQVLQTLQVAHNGELLLQSISLGDVLLSFITRASVNAPLPPPVIFEQLGNVHIRAKSSKYRSKWGPRQWETLQRIHWVYVMYVSRR